MLSQPGHADSARHQVCRLISRPSIRSRACARRHAPRLPRHAFAGSRLYDFAEPLRMRYTAAHALRWAFASYGADQV